MSKFKIKHQNISFAAIILLAVIARIIPHPPNFAPIGGLALFSGSHFRKILAFIIPLSAMLISDMFLGLHNTIVFVYVSFFITVIIGRYVKRNWQSLVFASVLSSVLFFMITNFGVWVTGTMYQKSISGLLECYLMGLPFFRNTLISDLTYTFSFFYGYRFLSFLLSKKAYAK